MAGGADGAALGAIGAGALFLYASFSGRTILGGLQALVQGKSPSTAKQANTITPPSSLWIATPAPGTPTTPSTPSSPGSPAGAPSPSGGGGGTPTANQALAMMLAVSMGHPSWATGQQWTDWKNLWNRESGWNQNAIYPSTTWPAGSMPPAGRAYGIAQSLTHGGPGFTEYGGYGLSTAESIKACLGSAYYQIVWGINYISTVYGSPSSAWATELAKGGY